jgi:mevalonate kinase
VRVEAGKPGSGVSLSTELGGATLEATWPTRGHVDPDGGALRFVPAVLHMLAARGLEVPDVRLTVRSDLPAARGFSSSAAFTLAVTDALARTAGRTFEAEDLARAAYHVERDLLGVECGLLDPLTCASKAPVLIRWSEEIDGGYDLRTVSLGADTHLFVGAFPTPRDTRGILSALNRDHRAGGSATRTAFAVFEEAALDASDAMEAGDGVRLGANMDRAQSVYEEVLEAALPELSAPMLRRACSALLGLGALGAKFSGAGGDGSVIALFRSAEDASDAATVLEDEFGVVATVLHLAKSRAAADPLASRRGARSSEP